MVVQMAALRNFVPSKVKARVGGTPSPGRLPMKCIGTRSTLSPKGERDFHLRG
jgi:hypothetical protein